VPCRVQAAAPMTARSEPLTVYSPVPSGAMLSADCGVLSAKCGSAEGVRVLVRRVVNAAPSTTTIVHTTELQG
jgi:hypothetical protein